MLIHFRVNSSQEKTFRFIINAHSLVKNYDEICNLINRLQHKFSVTARTETWTAMKNEELMVIEGYNKLIKHTENKKVEE